VQRDRLLSVVDGLYGAALEPETWPQALDRVRGLYDGAIGVLFLQDTSTGDICWWTGAGTDPAGEREYLEHIKDINPRTRFSVEHPPGTIAWDYRVMPEEAMRRHPFYDWLERVQDLRYFIGSRMFESGGCSAFMGIDWPTRHGHVERSTIDLFAGLLPHLAQAFRLTLSRLDAEDRAAALDSVVDRFACGVVILDARGRVLHVNPRAASIFDRGDGLDLSRGTIAARRASDTRKLHRLIDVGLRAAETDALPMTTAIPVPRLGSDLPYLVTVAPLPTRALPDATTRPVLAMIIRESPVHDGPSRHLLTQTLGLTPREADLALALLANGGIKAAASRMGIAPATARVHLRNIFRKTQVHSQKDLVRLLSQVASLGEGIVERPTLDRSGR